MNSKGKWNSETEIKQEKYSNLTFELVKVNVTSNTGISSSIMQWSMPSNFF